MVVTLLGLLAAGLLAGEELVVRWGVGPALRALPDDAHVRARIALVHRLRVVVPLLIVPTVVLTTIAVIVAGGALAWTGLGVLAVFVVVTAAGTVPVNMRIAEWDPAHPPSDWAAEVRRWERIDVVRSSAAVLAFVVLLVGRRREVLGRARAPSARGRRASTPSGDDESVASVSAITTVSPSWVAE